ncbi:dTDP-4-dehydrorhamnose reductase [Shewanella kaireitica]|uniref:dTDP-4-dehydrorhamnose reductase n=1 Tax=Shewanella kaireitica TaxID=212021 RepID=UPI00200D6203|nr:dTDP-4-dehydrorhamnose reductase [Shewanella kaireitica]MCL1095731.1 dTDP-4-dehydrorhamnose reductase [Shewanella kaireitica]
MRILVTGSNGQVGSSLVECLNSLKANSQEAIEFLALDRNELDITNQVAVIQVVESFKPDFIINAAAHTAVDRAEEEVELSYAINRDGPKFLAEAANALGTVMLHISTDYVFPGNKEGVYTERDKTGPLSVYGQSKLAGEQAVIDANSKHIILRTAWVFSEHGNNFVKTMLRVGAAHKKLNVVADQFGGPTYAGDIADALITMVMSINRVAQNHKFGVFHFAGYPHVSWCEFAKVIFELADQTNLIQTPMINGIAADMYPTSAKRPENSKLSCDKINAIFGITASDWKAALNNIELYKS